MLKNKQANKKTENGHHTGWQQFSRISSQGLSNLYEVTPMHTIFFHIIKQIKNDSYVT